MVLVVTNAAAALSSSTTTTTTLLYRSISRSRRAYHRLLATNGVGRRHVVGRTPHQRLQGRRRQHLLPLLPRRGCGFSTLTSSSSSSTTTTTTPPPQPPLLDDQGLLVFKTLHELQEAACQVYHDKQLFGTYSSTTQSFEYMTYNEFGVHVSQCRAVLKDLGVGPYDRVALISNNRWEWPVIACAAYSLQASLVPMYEAQLPSDWTYILNDSGANVVICSTDDIFQTLNDFVLPQTPHVHSALCLDADTGVEYAYKTAIDRASKNMPSSITLPPTPDDLANLLYTSGTTGKPKGVELTHDNFCSNIHGGRAMAADPFDLVSPLDRSLAFLPWAHSYGQTVELWMGMSAGGSAGICRGIPHILEDLELVKPTVLFSVPTLYKKVYDGVQNKIEAGGNSLPSRLLRKALDLGHQNAANKRGDVGSTPLSFVQRMQFAALDRIVLSKVRDRFGGRLRYGCVAGAACPKQVLEFMDSIGIPICEGYGLTETSPIITLNVPDSRTVGSVGRPLAGINVYIVDEDGNPVPTGSEGEICCVGPNVMRGYYNNPEATNEVITLAPDGVSRMFHTGDLGRMTNDGWLSVTGRIKEQYKLENGKFVVPTPVQDAIEMSRFIDRAVLYGANRPHNIVLIVPEWNAIRDELGLDNNDAEGHVSEEDLVHDNRVKTLLDEELRQSCAKLKKFEVPKDWIIVAPFTVENNMLTQKQSTRRHKVIEAYKDAIGRLYGDVVDDSHIGNDIKEAA